MARRVPSVAVLVLLLLGAVVPAAARASQAPLPASMAAVGDSITQAASTGGTLGADYPQNSWATGTNTTVNSHYLRLLAAGASVSGQNHNRSVSGAKAADLNAQMQNVLELQPDYLTVLIGGNDLCTDTVEQMTSVADFRTHLSAAMGTLAQGSPESYVYVVSIPNVYQLWELFKNDWWARLVWSSADICQSLLANPTSTTQADVQRREVVRQRNIDYNAVLAEVCAAYARCHFDGNAVFNTAFTENDVSGDYFHPSLSGQAKLASVSWDAGFAWGSPPPAENQAPTASFTSTCVDLTCSFTNASTDADGSIASSSWAFGDGNSSTATSPSHTFAAGGTYTVTLTVTDDEAATSSASQAVTVTAPAMWFGDVSGTSRAAKGNWTATVTVTVSGASGSVGDAVVSGSWSTGASAGCTTSASGSCSFQTTFNKKVTTATYTVTGLAKSGWVYDAARNVDTDATVQRP